jgi:hypothetical protein
MSAQIYNGVTGKIHALEFLQDREVVVDSMGLLTEPGLEPKDKTILEETVKAMELNSRIQAALSLGRLKVS